MKVLMFMAMVVIVSVPVTWAEQPATQSGIVATATSVGLDGKPIQVNEFAFTDTWRQNRYYSVTQTLTSDQLRDPAKPWNAKSNPYEPKAITIATSHMSGNGAAGIAAAGFVTNLGNAPGLIGLGALLRPSTTNQTNNGGNQSQATGPINQSQGQAQNQTALGGAGGAGGSATINAAGGVGNTTIKATGNGKVNVGDASGIGVSISQ